MGEKKVVTPHFCGFYVSFLSAKKKTTKPTVKFELWFESEYVIIPYANHGAGILEYLPTFG